MIKKYQKLDKCSLRDDHSKAISFFKSNNMDLSISPDGAIQTSSGITICNFYISLIKTLTLYGTDNKMKDYLFKIKVITKNLCLIITISLSEISNSKWLTSAGAGLYLTEPKHYHYLLQIFHVMLDSTGNKEPAFEETGMHFIDGQWIYATSNLLIYPDKLCWTENMYFVHCKNCSFSCSECPYRLNSSLEKTNYPDRGKIQNIITSLISLLSENIETTIPIFMMNLLSCASSVFTTNGLFVPIVLWITGFPGSGKSQLAMYLGSFYHKPEKRNDAQLISNYLKANDRTPAFRKYLEHRRDNTSLEDDVKADNSTSLKEHKYTNTDIATRSAKDHSLEGKKIHTNLIVTGEYIPDMASTLSRLIILPLKGFSQAPQDLKSLQSFQDNGYLITDFVILFTQWICQKLNVPDFISSLQEQKDRYVNQYMEENFSARNSEMLATLCLCLLLLEDFCNENTRLSYRKKISSLIEKGTDCYKRLILYTSCLHEDTLQLYAEILSNLILKDETIRSAPEITYNGKLDYFNYLPTSMENGIYIKSPSVLSNIAYFKKPSNCQPYLMVRKKLLEDLPYELENYCIKHGLPSEAYKRYRFSCLKDNGLLLAAYNRSDKGVNYAMNYPVYDICKQEIKVESFYCINLQNTFFKRLKNTLSKRIKKRSCVFQEITEETFNSDYEQGYVQTTYANAEDVNYYKCISQENIIKLDSYKNCIQNIFQYRHTKG